MRGHVPTVVCVENTPTASLGTCISALMVDVALALAYYCGAFRFRVCFPSDLHQEQLTVLLLFTNRGREQLSSNQCSRAFSPACYYREHSI